MSGSPAELLMKNIIYVQFLWLRGGEVEEAAGQQEYH